MISDLISKIEKLKTDKEISLVIRKEIEDGKLLFKDVVEFLETDNVDEICWGIQILSHFETKNITQMVKKYLNHPDFEIRYCAVVAYRLNPHPEAVPDLIFALSHPDALYCRFVADALVAIGKPATPALMDYINKPIDLSVIEAVRALALIGDKPTIPTLFSLLESDSSHIQYWAEKGLDDMGVGMTFFDPS